jgi:predicted SnoaL-like aldol condensation-catalyzing enzyme
MTENAAKPAGVSRKQTAIAFLRLAASGKAREAFQKHVAPDFRHHNPFFRGDADSLMTAMEENAAKNPDKVLEIQRALEDGDLVAVHSRVRQKPGDLGAAVVHILKFQGDRIVELWDMGQPVPETSPNENGMF